jgi:K+-sensing histidine kinase KdpD
LAIVLPRGRSLRQWTTVTGLFAPFRRLHDRSGDEGFGLGLAIVASISAVHDGTVTAEPLADGGLKVTVALPSTAESDTPSYLDSDRVPAG